MAKRALVIAPQWMGDAVMSNSLIQLLARDYQVDVLCASWLKPIYQGMAEVNQVIALDLQHGKLQLGLYWQTAKQLRGHYQACYIIPRKLKAALIPWLAKIPQRVGYLGESRYGLINRRIRSEAEHKLWVQKICALYDKQAASQQSYPLPKLQTNAQNKEKWLQQLKPDKAPLVALMPGASYGPSKQWPVEQFHQAVKILHPEHNIVILGGKKEQQIGEQIKQGFDTGVSNLCAKTSLQDAVDILSISDFCISNDSGLMHVAAASGCFVKALYGSSSPDYTPPLTDNKQIFSDKLDCKPCFERRCRYGHYHCWQKVTPKRVLEQ